jgi:drug/metabolite transporter (DMT)-like permease
LRQRFQQSSELLQADITTFGPRRDLVAPLRNAMETTMFNPTLENLMHVDRDEVRSWPQHARAPWLTSRSASLLLLLAAALWGGGNVAQKTVLEHLDPISAVGLRCAVGAIVIAPFAIRTLWSLSRGCLSSMLGISTLLTIAMLLQQWAYLGTSVSNASFLVSTATVMTPIAAWALIGERPGWVVCGSAVTTLAGVLLLVGGIQTIQVGDLLSLLAAAVYALWMIKLGQHMQRFGNALSLGLAQFLTVAALTLPFGMAGGNLTLGAVVAAAPELLIMGVFATAIAFCLQSLAQAYVSPSHAAVMVSSESVFGALSAALFLGERLTPTAFCGAAMVLAAVLFLAARRDSPASPTKASTRTSSAA